jgi:hypothetical protein
MFPVSVLLDAAECDTYQRQGFVLEIVTESVPEESLIWPLRVDSGFPEYTHPFI